MEIKTAIIPIQPRFVKVDLPHKLNLEAICVFTAIGFFLDEDTYWKDMKCLKPASCNTFDSSNNLIESKPWFKWHYTPRDITFEQALDEFSNLFETIVKEQTQDKKVILPLSGGLDSRTQAVALQYLKADVVSYSYKFQNGYNEIKIAKQIAKACDFSFSSFTIPKSYLWNRIDELAKINQCYSDFTSPRQMAIHDKFDNMGDVFSLGHWGDVLFDSKGLPQLSKKQEIEVISKKLLKRGGLELATKLWESWNLHGDFESYFKNRISTLLSSINIDDSNAKLRAFKSLYWAPRWTSVNLSIFEKSQPITLPYYDNRMCEFICTIPETYLKNRRLQIAYIKKRSPQLAKITWQDHRPFNLTNYHLNRLPFNIPFRVYHKTIRTLNATLGKHYIQRNWELQFIGRENQKYLKKYLLNNGLESFIPKPLIKDNLEAFIQRDNLANAHAINMLLVLSKFNQLNTSTSSV